MSKKEWNLCKICNRKAPLNSKTCKREKCKMIAEIIGDIPILRVNHEILPSKPKNPWVEPFTLDITNDPSGRMLKYERM